MGAIPSLCLVIARLLTRSLDTGTYVRRLRIISRTPKARRLGGRFRGESDRGDVPMCRQGSLTVRVRANPGELAAMSPRERFGPLKRIGVVQNPRGPDGAAIIHVDARPSD
jgi:hypothetical protein